jgi:hypothetical protein
VGEQQVSLLPLDLIYRRQPVDAHPSGSHGDGVQLTLEGHVLHQDAIAERVAQRS